jgi:hypothetical protein
LPTRRPSLPVVAGAPLSRISLSNHACASVPRASTDPGSAASPAATAGSMAGCDTGGRRAAIPASARSGRVLRRGARIQAAPEGLGDVLDRTDGGREGIGAVPDDPRERAVKAEGPGREMGKVGVGPGLARCSCFVEGLQGSRGWGSAGTRSRPPLRP